jgi:hypothetical protein
MPNKTNAIGRPSKLVISDYDIRILVKIGITSTYPKIDDFCGYKIISLVGAQNRFTDFKPNTHMKHQRSAVVFFSKPLFYISVL